MHLQTISAYLRRLIRQLSSIQTLVLGFLLLILLGTGLLMLPISTQDGRSQSFVDALFMATSAISTTGLSLVHLNDYYTLFGQLVLLLLMQIGGLGYMTLILFVIYIFGESVSYRNSHIMEQSMAVPSRGELRVFIKRIIKITLLFEGLGALALTLYWLPNFPLSTAVYMGIFHAISGFCAAGLSLLDHNFIIYQTDWTFNIIINLICIAGVVGFFVWNDLYNVFNWLWRHKKIYHLSVHSKLAITVSLALLALATAVLLFTNDKPTHHSWLDWLLISGFQSLSATSSAGFNTIDITQLNQASQFILSLVMFIGSPAGGTGGGIKSTTFGVILLLLWAVLKNNRDITAFGRRIPQDTLAKSIAIGVTAVLWWSLAVIALTLTETDNNFPFLYILFESVSALGTNGLSVGISPQLSDAGKIILTLTMFIGRVGPLTAMFSLFGRQSPKAYRYPEGDVFVG